MDTTVAGKSWSFYLAGLALAFFSTTFSSSEALRFFESIFSIGLDLVCMNIIREATIEERKKKQNCMKKKKSQTGGDSISLPLSLKLSNLDGACWQIVTFSLHLKIKMHI